MHQRPPGALRARRQFQIRALVERIEATVPHSAPLIIAGDFNDWRSKGDRTLTDALHLTEVFEEVTGRPARTFPALLPVFRLDRIYARGLKVIDAKVHYVTAGARMSDHAALAATFELADPRKH
ncbi:MAG TPA: endonuclease/exonuclease/phosphatase family protein [Casimicrobiaceae bacterium]|nr:endonuclease/exonuclease/phosphatase family protein [Casimicrobiaceae bacterium]